MIGVVSAPLLLAPRSPRSTDVHSRYMVYVNDHTKPHSVCDEKYWMGPAKAAGWIPQDPVCAADSARSRRRMDAPFANRKLG